jgi:DNA-binding MarR family transcriptional regulator
MDAMRRASAVGVLHSQAVARHAGLSSTDLECLDLILMGGPATAGQIGQRTGLSSGAVTGLVDRLEAQGFVRRAVDPSDRRKVLVEARHERMGDLQALFQPLDQRFSEFLKGYDDAFLAQVADFLDRAEAVAMARVEALNHMPRGSKE